MSAPDPGAIGTSTRGNGARPGFVPLSDQLLTLVKSPEGSKLTLNQLMDLTRERGPYGLIILLCLPFMTPVSLPGVSNIFGLVIVLLAWRIFHGQPPHLPRHIGERRIEGKVLAKVIQASIRVLRYIESWTRPRGSSWIRGGMARRLNAVVLIYGGLLLAAPIPPIIPLSNLTPSVGIILIAASMMEEDGVILWFGYLATVATTIYLGTLIYIQSALIWRLWEHYSDPVFRYLRGLLP